MSVRTGSMAHLTAERTARHMLAPGHDVGRAISGRGHVGGLQSDLSK